LILTNIILDQQPNFQQRGCIST